MLLSDELMSCAAGTNECFDLSHVIDTIIYLYIIVGLELN